MDSARRTVCVKKRAGCRMVAVVAAAATIAATLDAAQSLEAKPIINITFCGGASGGQAPFWLYWTPPGPGTNNAPNYIWVYLYNVNGNVLSGYPIEDPTNYVIPTTQTSSTCTTATGFEPDSATGAATVMLNVSGDWNGASCGPEACGSSFPQRDKFYVVNDRDRPALQVSFTRARSQERSILPTLEVQELLRRREWEPSHEEGLSFPAWAGTIRRVPGAAKKRAVWLYLANPSHRAAYWHIGYALLKKKDPEKGHIIPVKWTDSRGKSRMFHSLEHDGSPKYVVAGHTAYENAVVVKDLRIDLAAGGIEPTDYVYLDVFAMDSINFRNTAMKRIQLQP